MPLGETHLFDVLQLTTITNLSFIPISVIYEDVLHLDVIIYGASRWVHFCVVHLRLMDVSDVLHVCSLGCT
jgi:uncharacterized protein YlaN (UPF0358 family)